MFRFRVLYHPTSAAGVPVSNPSGQTWAKEVDAPSRGEAERAAAKLIGHPHVIVETERMDDVEVVPLKRKRAARRPKLEALGLVTAAALLARSNGSTS